MSWDAPQVPDYRASMIEGVLMIVMWGPGLITGWGPWNRLLDRGPGFSAADLTIMRDAAEGHEAIVKELTRASDKSFRQALTVWGASLGYRRLWFDDEVVPLEPSCAPSGKASTRCGRCGSEWAEHCTDFWLVCCRAGTYPLLCALCGSSLPVWRVEAEDLRAADGMVAQP
jgi:hypothetical protein